LPSWHRSETQEAAVAHASSTDEDRRQRLLEAFAETGDPALLDQLDALEPGDGAAPVPAERLFDVLDRLRDQTDPGRREVPAARPAAPERPPAWGLLLGVAAAVALVVVAAAAPPDGAAPLGPQVRGEAAAPVWPDAAQALLLGCCAAGEPVRARLTVDGAGRVSGVELLGNEPAEARALDALGVLDPAPSALRGTAVDIWLR
jgi:hypothetical protein